MQGEGRIAEADVSEISPWEPLDVLAPADFNLVKYSRGFLRARPEFWLRDFASFWQPLFHVLDAKIENFATSTQADFPPDLQRIVAIEVNGEIAVLGADEPALEALVEAAVPGCPPSAAPLVCEYLERRLVGTLAKAAKFDLVQNAYYLPPDWVGDVEVVGAVSVKFEINGKPVAFWVGLGRQMIDRLDEIWRAELVRKTPPPKIVERRSGDRSSVTVELAELAVPPAMLIDYIRPGTVINLEVPVSPRVIVHLDGELWLEGRLSHFNNQFVVEVSNPKPEKRSFPESTTKVQIRLLDFEISRSSLAEYSQVGAILVTRRPAEPRAGMIISGENVASAIIGQLDGNFVIEVIDK